MKHSFHSIFQPKIFTWMCEALCGLQRERQFRQFSSIINGYVMMYYVLFGITLDMVVVRKLQFPQIYVSITVVCGIFFIFGRSRLISLEQFYILFTSSEALMQESVLNVAAEFNFTCVCLCLCFLVLFIRQTSGGSLKWHLLVTRHAAHKRYSLKMRDVDEITGKSS